MELSFNSSLSPADLHGSNQKAIFLKIQRVKADKLLQSIRRHKVVVVFARKTEIVKHIEWHLCSHAEGKFFSCVPVKQKLPTGINLLLRFKVRLYRSEEPKKQQW